MISVRHLAGLGDRTDGAVGCRESSGLPLHGLLPRRSCPHLVLISYELSIWYDDSLIEMTGTKHTGLSPDKITPMLGVLAHGVAGRAAFEISVVCRDPVNGSVVCRMMKNALSIFLSLIAFRLTAVPPELPRAGTGVTSP